MRYIFMVGIILGVVGCQAPPAPSIEKLDLLSNDDLCRALGTYNNNSTLVLKIHDELNKRSEQIDREMCYILEKIENKKSKLETNKITISKPLTENEYLYSRKNASDNHKFKKYEGMKRGGKTLMYKDDSLNPYTSTSGIRAYPSASSIQGSFPTKIESNEKIDMSEKEMGELMRACLQKHISKSHINTNRNK